MERIERIAEMEKILDAAEPAVKELFDALEKYISVKDDIKTLAEYYTSPLWMSDFMADERGELPHNLKRGVLSEDAVYNLLGDNDEIFRIMGNLIPGN